LTAQQVQARDASRFDLATGYPIFPLPPELVEVVLDATRKSLLPGGGPEQLPNGRFLEDEMDWAVKTLLGIPGSCHERVRSTLSGSIALDRALCAAKLISQSNGLAFASLVVDQPCLDIGVAMAEFHYGLNTTVYSRSSSSSVCRGDSLRSTISSAASCNPPRQIVVLITSPDNPTGDVWSVEDLQIVANECRQVDAVLVADHSFALAGVHSPCDLPMIWDLPSGSCDWFAIWDTGKTIDVSGQKVGFILASNEILTQALDQVLYMIQFAPSHLALSVFRALFLDYRLTAYISHLGSACRKNLEELASCLPGGALIVSPKGGSLAWIDLSSSLVSGEELCRDWQHRGVSSVSGGVFFASPPRPGSFLRVALARSESYFEQAISHVQIAGLGGS
jgi:hypothetical protein